MATLAVASPRRHNNVFAMAATLLLVASLVFVVANQAHANAKHKEAELVRTTYRNGLCSAVEMWFSPTRGLVLILCKLDDTDLWGGMPIRFVENYLALTTGVGQVRWLSETAGTCEAYECTCMARPRAYWDRVVKVRDGYFALSDFTDVEFRFIKWITTEF